MDNQFKCPNCGGDELIVIQCKSKTGLFCTSCGTRLRWLTTRKAVEEAYEHTLNSEDLRCRAIKKIIHIGKTTIIRCEKCDCQLYSSGAYKPLGQFDLIDANFCPVCGAEFVEAHKSISSQNYRRN